MNIIGALASIYGVYLGIEVIARQNELTSPIWMLSFIVILFLVAKEINPDNFRPILENGIMPVIKGSTLVSPFGEKYFCSLLALSYLNKKGSI